MCFHWLSERQYMQAQSSTAGDATSFSSHAFALLSGLLSSIEKKAASLGVLGSPGDGDSARRDVQQLDSEDSDDDSQLIVPAAAASNDSEANPHQFLAADRTHLRNLIACALDAVFTHPSRTNDQLPTEHSSITAFHSASVPKVSAAWYFQRIAEYIDCGGECFVLAMVYLNRIDTARRGVPVDSLTIHRLLLPALVVAAKFFDDRQVSHALWARVGGVSCRELSLLERELLIALDHSLFVEPEEFFAVYKQLCNPQLHAKCNNDCGVLDGHYSQFVDIDFSSNSEEADEDLAFLFYLPIVHEPSGSVQVSPVVSPSLASSPTSSSRSSSPLATADSDPLLVVAEIEWEASGSDEFIVVTSTDLRTLSAAADADAESKLTVAAAAATSPSTPVISPTLRPLPPVRSSRSDGALLLSLLSEQRRADTPAMSSLSRLARFQNRLPPLQIRAVDDGPRPAPFPAAG